MKLHPAKLDRRFCVKSPNSVASRSKGVGWEEAFPLFYFPASLWHAQLFAL